MYRGRLFPSHRAIVWPTWSKCPGAQEDPSLPRGKFVTNLCCKGAALNQCLPGQDQTAKIHIRPGTQREAGAGPRRVGWDNSDISMPGNRVNTENEMALTIYCREAENWAWPQSEDNESPLTVKTQKDTRTEGLAPGHREASWGCV